LLCLYELFKDFYHRQVAVLFLILFLGCKFTEKKLERNLFLESNEILRLLYNNIVLIFI